jgi:hypothetical protein
MIEFIGSIYEAIAAAATTTAIICLCVTNTCTSPFNMRYHR